MDTFSEDALREHCPHCDPQSFALKYPLQETDRFWVVCDVHPLTKGHILIIPKTHVSCIGEYPEELYEEFTYLYDIYERFLSRMYGRVGSFEHGKIGQTVFHSHVQMFPFAGGASDVVPEGESHLHPLTHLDELRNLFKSQGGYLYFSLGDSRWTVDTALGQPRFFRDRFARAMGCPERGNWKDMHANAELMQNGQNDITDLLMKWRIYPL